MSVGTRRTAAFWLMWVGLAACSEAPSLVDERVSLDTRENRRRRIVVNLGDSLVQVGDSVLVSVQVIAPDGSRGETLDGRATLSSRDPALAQVLGRVRVRGVSEGRTWIVASLATMLDSAPITIVPRLTAAPPPSVRPDSVPQLPPEPGISVPLLPAGTVDTTMPRILRTIRVPMNNAAALQAVLDTARSGDEILLPNGSVYRGNFTLPRRAASVATVIRSEAVPVSPGTRITPSLAPSIATIETVNSGPALAALPGTHGWRVVGVRVQLASGVADNFGILRLGDGTERTLGDLPSNIVIDRSIITGGPTGSSSRCIALNSAATAIINSWISECHARGRDSQGIGGWNGSGPFLIQNNHIEGAGQNIMFGGADPSVPELTPADITIRRNHLFKPLSWAGRWTVKAAFELKHARRLLFEGNVIENHWADAQAGFAILFQAVSQDGRAPWTRIWDITVRHNVIRNTLSGANVLSRFGAGTQMPTEPSRRIWFHNNLFREIGRDPVTGATGGRFLQILGDLVDPAFTNNTMHGTGAGLVAIFDGTEQITRLVLLRNVFGASEYGLLGSNQAEGSGSLAHYAPGATVAGNVFTGRIASRYPSGNFFPADLGLDAFVSPAAGDWTLRSSLPFARHAGQLVGVSSAAAALLLGNAAP